MLMPLVHTIRKICGVLINVGMWTLDWVFYVGVNLGPKIPRDNRVHYWKLNHWIMHFMVYEPLWSACMILFGILNTFYFSLVFYILGTFLINNPVSASWIWDDYGHSWKLFVNMPYSTNVVNMIFGGFFGSFYLHFSFISIILYFGGVFIKTIIHYFALVGYKIFCIANSQNAMEASTIKWNIITTVT